jgi:hypothetical protein
MKLFRDSVCILNIIEDNAGLANRFCFQSSVAAMGGNGLFSKKDSTSRGFCSNAKGKNK